MKIRINKKYLVLSLLVFFSSLCYISPVNARSGTYRLLPNTYIKDSYYMSSIDTYKWSFTSSVSGILVLGLSQAQYEAFYNLYLSKYTARLNKNSQYDDSGSWNPPRLDKWHILYINTGSETYITIESSGTFITFPLIIAGILSIIIIIIGLIARRQHIKKKRAKQIQEPMILQEESNFYSLLLKIKKSKNKSLLKNILHRFPSQAI